MGSKKAESTYWSNVVSAFNTLSEGLLLTVRHLRQITKRKKTKAIAESQYFDEGQGVATIQYPFEAIPVPDTGRYRLHNEMEDCIVCDKCAKICPVDCIEIEPIRAVEDMGKTSDGTPKRIHAAKFDIDMGKCCFCGLCTTVCPTECLTMTKAYDFSVYDIKDHVYSFGLLDEQEAIEKRSMLDEFNKAKPAARPERRSSEPIEEKPGTARPKFRPKLIKKSQEGEDEGTKAPRPKFIPKVKPGASKKSEEGTEEEKPRPKFRPKIKPPKKDDNTSE